MGFGGGGMISTCAQLLQTSLLVFQNNMVLGVGVGGGHGKHTAQLPALLPDYKIAWFCGGGGLVWGGA